MEEVRKVTQMGHTFTRRVRIDIIYVNRDAPHGFLLHTYISLSIAPSYSHGHQCRPISTFTIKLFAIRCPSERSLRLGRIREDTLDGVVITGIYLSRFVV